MRCCRRRRALWWCFRLALRFLGLRQDERRSLRMRYGSCQLCHGQSSGGQQQDAKVCHDVLRSRKVLGAKVLGSNGAAFTEGFGWSING
jgi:hypothetical protein